MSKTLLLISLVATILAAVLAFTPNAVHASREHVTVNTKYGPIVGYKNEFGGYSFLGVPFASAPVGKLRFRPPVDPAPWTTPLNCTEFRSGCMAHCNGKFAKLMCPEKTSEDCLYLNIYTPAIGKGKDMPTLYFMHGGMDAWGSGSIPLYSGSKWGVRQNMVVVTMNYRENLFGGLMTKNVVGNFMIRDSIQALKFIQEVITEFGGSPKRVTISGQSSGAAMTGTLYTSPKAYQYFQSAAIISDPIGFTPASQKMARELGDLCLIKLGCPTGASAEEEFACLEKKTAEEILKASKTTYLPTPNEVLSAILPWQPSVDNELVFDSPITQIEKGAFNKVPLYIGTVANETVIFVNGINIKVSSFLLDLALDYIFGLTKGWEISALYGPIPKNFNNGSKSGMMYFSEILTDYTFYCPTHHIAGIIASHGVPVHVYFFDHVPSWAEWYSGPPCGTNMVCHAYDLPTLFDTIYKLPKDFPRPTKEEDMLSKFMQDAVGMFVKTGTMSGNGWPLYNNHSRVMMNYSTPMPDKTVANYRGKFCDFWNNKIGYNRH